MQHTLFSGLALNFLNNVSLSRADSPSEAIPFWQRSLTTTSAGTAYGQNPAGLPVRVKLESRSPDGSKLGNKDPPLLAHRSQGKSTAGPRPALTVWLAGSVCLPCNRF